MGLGAVATDQVCGVQALQQYSTGETTPTLDLRKVFSFDNVPLEFTSIWRWCHK